MNTEFGLERCLAFIRLVINTDLISCEKAAGMIVDAIQPHLRR